MLFLLAMRVPSSSVCVTMRGLFSLASAVAGASSITSIFFAAIAATLRCECTYKKKIIIRTHGICHEGEDVQKKINAHIRRKRAKRN